MAVVVPYPALRYDPAKVGGLERVLAQPYDKITPEMARAYWNSSPYNLAYLTKGEAHPGDSPANNVYTRAAELLRKWRQEGILAQRSGPAFYAYFQEFAVPGDPSGKKALRKSFIALGKLENYESGVIFRHEQTLSAPKVDRLELLRATRANLESIFMLYSDAKRTVDKLLDEVAKGAPSARITDEYGVVNTVWDINDPAKVQQIEREMAAQTLIIADGHHRYETALNFKRECEAMHPGKSLDCSLALMTFVNMESEGIVILPTHRLLSGIAQWDSDAFIAKASQYFKVTERPFAGPELSDADLGGLRATLQAAYDAKQICIGALFAARKSFVTLELRPDVALETLLPELSAPERRLDVTVLHRIALALCLGMDEESVRKEKFLSYVRHFDEGIQGVQGGAQACFFLNPVRIEQVREIAFQGRLMPQKSTDFYPKLLSGLAMYPMNH